MFQEINIPQVDITYKQPVGLFINNQFVESSDKQKIDTFNPATKEKITSIYSATEEDIEKAVQAAKKAYKTVWSKKSPDERSVLLLKLCSLIERDEKLLGAIETLDSGKPYHTNALVDLAQIKKVVRYYAGSTDKYTKGETVPISHDKFIYTQKSPYGVVGQVVPWNYPLAMASWHIFGCLASGNVSVIKPAANTSLSLLYLAQLFAEAGFPPGVLNVLPGKGSVIGTALARHKDIDKVSFTGSTAVGRTIMEEASKSNLKDVTLECGGKSPAVVFEDAQLDKAIQWVANGICFNTGQNCTANSRIYVQDTIYDKFVSQFLEHVKETWKFGPELDPFSKGCTMGPVISEKQYDIIKKYIEHGQKEEKLKMHQLGEFPSKGYFIPPVMFTDVPQDSKLVKEEIFGPVAVISKFSTYEEALELANDTDYGLAAMVFSENVRTIHSYVRDIQAGTVWCNCSNEVEIAAPFGGFKMSGIGRELGVAGVDSYTHNKSAHINISPEK